MNLLEAQFKSIMQSGKFAAGMYETDGNGHTPPAILTQDLADKINAAGFEATAITAAVSLKKSGQTLWERAETTSDPEEKSSTSGCQTGNRPI